MVVTRPLHAGHHPLKLLSQSPTVSQQRGRFWLIAGALAALVALKLTKSIRHRLWTVVWDIISWLLEVKSLPVLDLHKNRTYDAGLRNATALNCHPLVIFTFYSEVWHQTQAF